MMRALAPGARLRHAIIPLSAAALAFGLFLLIAVAVSTGLTRGIDAWVLLALRDAADASRPFGPAWLQETGRDFTGLGSNGVRAVLVLAGSGLLALAPRRTGLSCSRRSGVRSRWRPCSSTGMAGRARNWSRTPYPCSRRPSRAGTPRFRPLSVSP
jgi:hypothetical protein